MLFGHPTSRVPGWFRACPFPLGRLLKISKNKRCMRKGMTYSCGGIGRASDGQSGASWNNAGRVEETSTSAAQASIVGVLGDASWDRDSGLTAENDLWGRSDGSTTKSAKDQFRNCGPRNLRNICDDLCDSSINGLSSSWYGDGDFSGSRPEIGTAKFLSPISLEANESTEKVVARALSTLLDGSSLEDWKVVDDAWDVGEDGASKSSRGKKLREVHRRGCRVLCVGVSCSKVRR